MENKSRNNLGGEAAVVRKVCHFGFQLDWASKISKDWLEDKLIECIVCFVRAIL